LQQLAKEAGCSIRVHAGAELELNGHIWGLLQEDCSRYCLAGSHYILVSLPRASYVSQLESDLYQLMLQGFLPIIAQAEQSSLCRDNPQQLLEWMHHGVLLQCDLGSFNGAFGEKIRKLSQQLAGHRMITFWGSGQLNSDDLPKAIQAAEQSFSVADSQWDGWQQCSINSEKLLRDKFFYPILPEFWKKRKMGILSRLFGI
jgi:protein-tyrosine phosphatase